MGMQKLLRDIMQMCYNNYYCFGRNPKMKHVEHVLPFSSLLVWFGVKQSQTRQVGKYKCAVSSLLTSCCMISGCWRSDLLDSQPLITQWSHHVSLWSKSYLFFYFMHPYIWCYICYDGNIFYKYLSFYLLDETIHTLKSAFYVRIEL